MVLSWFIDSILKTAQRDPKETQDKIKRVLVETGSKSPQEKPKDNSIKILIQESPDKTQKNLLIESSSIYPWNKSRKSRWSHESGYKSH